MSKRKSSPKWAKLNAFVDLSLKDLTPAEVRVWVVLFRDLKPDGLARAGQADIARRAGLCVRAVGGAVRKLTDRGLVQVARRGRLNGGPSLYRVRGYNPDGPAEAPRGCPAPVPAE